MLDEIIKHKRNTLSGIDLDREIGLMRRALPNLAPVISLKKSLTTDSGISLIAEIKRRSPSKGDLAADLSVDQMVGSYETGGARGISVLTDKRYFAGTTEDLMAAKHITHLPVLRKDFIIHEYQVWESRLIGADAILLIAAVLTSDEIARLYSLAKEIGLEILVEVHSQMDIERIRKIEPKIIGINNRDLKTFNVDLATTERLRSLIPDDVVCLSESGIKRREDMVRLQACNVDAVLVGEGIVTSSCPEMKISELLGTEHDQN
ncbi:MAG: indole-3-glycerol phosphate synthase TrpC [FCB group bacterium]|nr:indole-3-glycerol phosphate synthase TrpC [FCB group bacterium]